MTPSDSPFADRSERSAARSDGAQPQSASPRWPPSKFRPPAVGHHFVPRERLLERIRQAPAKLVLVQAPAGFGTTSLLCHVYETCASQGCAIAWMTLDDGDNDLDRFLTGLAQAFAGVPGAAAPEGASFDPLHALAHAPLPSMLILDEFEHLQNPAVLAIVQQMAETLAPQQTVVLGSREKPMLGLGRLRARHRLLEIDAAQLRFTFEETARFLCERRGLALARADVQALHEITGGWAAALWLSSLALESSEDPKRFIRGFSGSHEALAAYLAEDVLSQKPAHLQEFILQTSVLHKFCADSCNAVTGRQDSRALLQEIERSNMFMNALDEQRSWFSYHPLFAGFLRAQLGQQHPGLAPTLHRRAADWYIGQNRPALAVEHAIAAGDTELVLLLLQRHAKSLFLQGRVRLLARWFDILPRAILAAHPKLMSVYAWSLIHTNRSAEALALIEMVSDADGASPMPHSAYHALRVFSLMMLDRVQETASLWDDPEILAVAAKEPLLHSMLMIACAYYYVIAGRYQEARQLLDQATQQQPAVGPLFSIAVAGYVRSMLDLLQGRLRAAGARLLALIGDESQMRQRSGGARLRSLMGSGPVPTESRHGADSGFASLYLAEVMYEMDTLAEAKRLLKLYLPLVKDAGVPDQLISSHLIYARILRAEGRANDALQTLLDLEQLGMQRRLPRVVDMARLEQARNAVLDGKDKLAKTMLALVGNAPAWEHPELQMIASDLETPLLGAMRRQIHAGHAAATLAALREHLQDAHLRGRLRYALRVKLLYALALAQAGQRNPALRALRETMQDAQQEGFVRIFKDEGPLPLPLIRDMLDGMRDSGGDSPLRRFAERILQSAHAVSARGLSADAGSAAGARGADSELTERELDVLMLLAHGCGNQTIAQKLFVSVTTVKTHLRSINLKLGAHNRTEAISVARRRGIIA
jgi:LuxR family maltose regulon positive regulatory protein